MKKRFVLVLLVMLLGLALSGEAQKAPPVEEVELVEAMSRGQVRCMARAGRDLSYVILHLHNPGQGTLHVLILPGTIFAPGAPGYQPMGVIEVVVVVLQPGEEREINVPTACFDMALDPPDEGMALTVMRGRDAELVARLCRSPTFQKASFRVRQFAIWTLFHRPTSIEDYRGVGFGWEFVEAWKGMGFPVDVLIYFFLLPEMVYELSERDLAVLMRAFTQAGIPVASAEDLYRLFTTRGPTKGELAQVRRIFQEAGLPLEDFPVLLVG